MNAVWVLPFPYCHSLIPGCGRGGLQLIQKSVFLFKQLYLTLKEGRDREGEGGREEEVKSEKEREKAECEQGKREDRGESKERNGAERGWESW